MSYEFACENVVPGCEGKVSGATKEEVLEAAAKHADEAHGIAGLDEATAQKVMAAIVSSD